MRPVLVGGVRQDVAVAGEKSVKAPVQGEPAGVEAAAVEAPVEQAPIPDAARHRWAELAEEHPGRTSSPTTCATRRPSPTASTTC